MMNDSNILTEDTEDFDFVNLFPGIDNFSGLEDLSEILEYMETNFPPTECILEVLKFCLECKKSIFKEKFYL